MSQLNVGTVNISDSLVLPNYTTAQRPSGAAVGTLIFNSEDLTVEIWTGEEWTSIGGGGGADGSSAERAANSVSEILALNPSAANGAYWLNVPNIGPRQIYCDMSNGGWMLVMRGAGNDSVAYDDSRWTSTGDDGANLLIAGSYGSFAKSTAFTAFNTCSQIRVTAGGFSGAGADGSYRSFEFSFGGTASPKDLMFTTQYSMTWNSSYSSWRSTFGQDRQGDPCFQRYGSSASQSVGQNRGLRGCGKNMMFGFNSHDNGNCVNSGLGTHPSYCGGSPGRFAGGSWMGNGGSVQIWAK
jgi:hypothetical protein